MKRFFPVIGLFLVFLVVSCSANGPKVVTENFCKALYQGDFEKAYEYCTEKSRTTLGFVKNYAGDKVELMKKADIGYEFRDEKLEDDGKRATVEVIISGSISLVDGTVQKQKEIKIHLVKNDDGIWQVNFENQ